MKARKKEAVHAEKSLGRMLRRYWQIYLLLLPGIIITVIYKYLPIYGVQIAFRDYNPAMGFFRSPWVGLKWFERFFTNYNSSRMIRNTILLSLYSILWTFPIPIILALLLNQMRFVRTRKVIQTVLYAPHFISIMIVCGMLRIFLSPYGGLVNIILQAFGAPIHNFIDDASCFRTIYIASSIWQDAGWGTIIYTATLASVDATLHEAARVDGASTLQRIRYVDIPELIPIIVIIVLVGIAFLQRFDIFDGRMDDTDGVVAQMKKILDMPVRIKTLLIGLVVLAAAVVFVARSGHTSGMPVSSLELRFRAMLEQAFYARPRTKELLIGHPAFLLAWMAFYRKWPTMVLGALVLVATIGQGSMVETFAHMRTPVYMSFMRGIGGIVLGACIGAVCMVLIELWQRLLAKVTK